MAFTQPPKNKMMETAPTKKAFHFSGDGIYHNASILAEDIEQATKAWRATRQLINPEQSTAAPKEEADDTLQ